MPSAYKGNRGEAINYIPALIEEGQTNSYIVDFLRINDLGYRTQLMYQDINRIRLEGIGAETIRGLDIYDPVPEKLMRTWSGDTSYNYRVVVEYEYYDTNALEIKKGYTTLYYNDAPSQSNVLDDWAIKRQTIENTYGQVQEVYGEKQLHYYRNIKGSS